MRCEHLVIGGGPAGAMAALLLARRGGEVVLVEKKAFPRRKVCGEFVAPRAIALLEQAGLGEAFHALAGPPIRRVALWQGEESIQCPMPAFGERGLYARALEREVLDLLLLDEAVNQGVEVLQPAAALSIHDGTCETTEGPIGARRIVAAHGYWEPGGLPTQPARRDCHAGDLFGFQAHFTGSAGPGDAIALLPFAGGYAGLVARRNQASTLALCVRRDALQRIRALSPGTRAGQAVFDFIADENALLVRALAGARHDGWIAAGPLRPGRRRAATHGIAAIGNAAMEVHPVIGEGIAMAMESAAALSGAPASPRLRNVYASSLLARTAMRPLAVRISQAILRAVPRLLGAAARLTA